MCLYSFWFTFLIMRRRWRVVPRLPKELVELFRAGASLVTVDVSTMTHLLGLLFLSLRADGARQVRLACAKPLTSREVDRDRGGGLHEAVPEHQTQFLDHVLCLEKHHHKSTGGASCRRLQELDPPRGGQTLRPSSSWKSSPTSNVSIWTPVPLCSASLLLSRSCTTAAQDARQPATSSCWLALHRLERGGAA